MTANTGTPTIRHRWWKWPVWLGLAGAGLIAGLCVVALTHELMLFAPWADRFFLFPLWGAIGAGLLAVALYAFGPAPFAEEFLTSRQEGISAMAVVVAFCLGALVGSLAPYAAVTLTGGPVAHQLTGQVINTNYGSQGGRYNRFSLLHLLGIRPKGHCPHAVAFRPEGAEQMYVCMNSQAEKAQVLANSGAPVVFVFGGWGNSLGLIWRDVVVLPTGQNQDL